MTKTRNRSTDTTRGKVLPPVRVSDDERAQIKAQASAASMSVSAYVRAIALTGRVTVKQPQADAEAVRLLLIAGNNINQLAKAANQLGRVDVVALHETLADLRAAAGKIVG